LHSTEQEARETEASLFVCKKLKEAWGKARTSHSASQDSHEHGTVASRQSASVQLDAFASMGKIVARSASDRLLNANGITAHKDRHGQIESSLDNTSCVKYCLTIVARRQVSQRRFDSAFAGECPCNHSSWMISLAAPVA
jgi:hypothetical protein